MSIVRLGLCCRSGGLRRGPAKESLRNAIRFFRAAQGAADPAGESLRVLRIDAESAELDRSIARALEEDVTHVLFLSPGAILPFYAIQRLIDLGARASSGISWTWRPGLRGSLPEAHPRLGFFDGEGRPYPYFGWNAPDVFEVDWCGLDCLLLEREAIEEIRAPLRKLAALDPAHRLSLSLRSRGIPIAIDSSVQCPRVLRSRSPGGRLVRKLVPNPRAWLEFSRDSSRREVPRGPVYDPAYRGRPWYSRWLERCMEAPEPWTATPVATV